MLRSLCNQEGLKIAANIIADGGTVVFPTDTVYGLGCDPFLRKAVNKVVNLKKRKNKPLPILISNVNRISKIVDLGDLGYKLAEKFWPGPLTLIAPTRCKKIVPEIMAGKNTLGIRVPEHAWLTRLIERVGGYIVGTSANRSGDTSPNSILEVFRSLGNGADLYVDGGITSLGKESTILDISNNKLNLIREGYIPFKIIEESLF